MSTINDTFQASFGAGVSILKDIAGTVRPDGVWDIGAYEFSNQTSFKFKGVRAPIE